MRPGSRPFDASDLPTAIEATCGRGLSPTGPLGAEISERAVHWRRLALRYALHNPLPRKPA